MRRELARIPAEDEPDELPLPLLPAGCSLADLERYALMPDGHGATAFLEEAEARAAAMPSNSGNNLRGEALENLVRAVMTLAPEAFPEGERRFTQVAATSPRRASENTADWSADMLWEADKRTLDDVTGGEGHKLHDLSRFSSKVDLVATAPPARQGGRERFIRVQCKNEVSAASFMDTQLATSKLTTTRQPTHSYVIGPLTKPDNAPELEGTTVWTRGDFCKRIPARFWRGWRRSLERGTTLVEPANAHVPARYTTTAEGARSVVEELRANDRAQIHMATGTGKTAVSVDSATALLAPTGGTVVVAVPSISLIDQTVDAWAKWAGEEVELDFAVLGGDAQPQPRLRLENGRRRLASVTNFRGECEEELSSWWNDEPSVPGRVRVLVTTYHSSFKLHQATRTRAADLLIVDEAHHAAGAFAQPRVVDDGDPADEEIDAENNESVSEAERGRARDLLVDDGPVCAARRLFLTATPRFVASEDTARDPRTGVGMQHPAFGKVAYALSYGEALKLGIVKEYELVIDLLVPDSDLSFGGELADLLHTGIAASASDDGRSLTLTFTSLPEGALGRRESEQEEGGSAPTAPQGTLAPALVEEERVKASAALTARLMARAMIVTGSKMGISFHSRTKEAEAHHEAISKVFPALLEHRPEYAEALGLARDTETRSFHLNAAKDSQAARVQKIREAQKGGVPTVINTCNGIAEGTDIPGADLIALLSPRYAIESIIQRIGRGTRTGNRIGDGRKFVVYVPILAERGPDGRLQNVNERMERCLRAVQAALRLMDSGFDQSFAALYETAIRRFQDAAAEKAELVAAEPLPQSGYLPPQLALHMNAEVLFRSLVLERHDTPERPSVYLNNERPILERILQALQRARAEDPEFTLGIRSWGGRFSVNSKNQAADRLGISREEFAIACEFRAAMRKSKIPPDSGSVDLWNALTELGFSMLATEVTVDPPLAALEERIVEDAGEVTYYIPAEALPNRATQSRVSQHRRELRQIRMSATDWSPEGVGALLAGKKSTLGGLGPLTSILAETPAEIMGMALRRIVESEGGLSIEKPLSEVEDVVSAMARERGFGFMLTATPWASDMHLRAYTSDWRSDSMGWEPEFWKPPIRKGRISVSSLASTLRAGVAGSRGAWLFDKGLGEAIASTLEAAGRTVADRITPGDMDAAVRYLLDDKKARKGRLASFAWTPNPFVYAALSRLDRSLAIVRLCDAIVEERHLDASVIEAFHELEAEDWAYDERTIHERFPVAASPSPRRAQLMARLAETAPTGAPASGGAPAPTSRPARARAPAGAAG